MRMQARIWPVALVLSGALPILAARPAPLQDWPNHVARVHILRGLLHGDAFWAQFYRLSGFLVPNEALDFGILGIARLGLPVEAAAQLFLLATYFIFVAGFCGLARALRAPGPAKPAFAVLLFYGHALFWGLVNYVLGVGLMLGLLALWLLAERRTVPRFAVAGLGAVLLLFTHVVAAVAWIILLGCFDLCRFLAAEGPTARHFGRRVLDSASWLAALLAVGALLQAMPGGAGHDFRIVYAGTGAGRMAARKLELFGTMLLGGSLVQDAASISALLVCIAAATLARPRLAAAPALAALALAVLSLAAPERIGTGSVLDTRLAILPLLMLAAAVRFEAKTVGTGVIAGAVLARTLVLAAYWHAAGLVFRDFRQQVAGLPSGSVMMVAYATKLPSLTWQQVWSPSITSIATQAAFHELFVPSIFANPTQQPIELRAAYLPLIQPWNLTDPANLQASADVLAGLCAEAAFPGVYLTVLYPSTFLAAEAGAALLHEQPHFMILDACRLKPKDDRPGR